MVAKLFKKKKTIPTILGILILLAGIGGSVYLVQTRSNLFLRASPTISPKQVKITNLSDNSFTVSWITEEATSGFVKYGTTSQIELTAIDDRDQETGKTGNYTTHYVNLKNLSPQTTYYFKIGSGKSLHDNNGNLYEVITASKIVSSPSASDPANGIVIKPDESPAEGTIVYLTIANVTPLSALTKSTGTWLIPLNNARSSNLSTYASYDAEASIEEIFVQGGSLSTATAITMTKNDNPVPTITLGKSHDFRQATELKQETTPSPESKFSFEPATSPATPTASQKEVTITSPSEEEEISTQKPEIFGKGPAGVEIEITVQSPAPYSAKITVNPDGTWSWTPPEGLEPGEHTVTVKYLDENGIEYSASHSFMILAAGDEELPSFEATPSASASPSPSATPSPSASPSAPSTRAAIPSTEGGVPEPGYLTPTFLLFIMGTGLISLGVLVNSLLRKTNYG